MKDSTASQQLRGRIGTLRQLEILLKVEECGGIASAAEQLHLTQPAASVQLKKLTDSIGVPLYEVRGRKLKLTDAGRVVTNAAREIIDCMARMEMQLNELQGMQAGRLSVAVETAAEYFISHLLGPFCRRYPGIELELSVGNHAQILQRLHDNRDDFYFFSHPPQHEAIETLSFSRNPLVVIAPSDHPLAGKKKVRWPEIADEKFIVRETGSGTRMTIEQHLDRLGIRLRHQMIVASNEAIKHAVLARMGLAIIPTHTLDEADRNDLVQLPVEGFPIRENWYLVHVRDKLFSVVADTFREYLLGEGASMLEDGLKYWEKHLRPKLPTKK